jgi:hypothetical protein
MSPRLYPFHPSIGRLRVTPDEPDRPAVVGPRKRGSRRPHADATVREVRRLIEQSVLTYTEIAAKTGVAQASICRWTRDGKWQRPLFAPRATDTVPSARAGARLKARTLAARLAALAERHIRELEASASVDQDKLAEALDLLKMAKLAARPKKRRRPAADAAADNSLQTFDAGARTVMRTLRAAGVNPERAPEEALEDFIASRAPPPARTPRRRGRRFTRNDYHAWLLQPIPKS